jgi:hypothetical protein
MSDSTQTDNLLVGRIIGAVLKPWYWLTERKQREENEDAK